eukprot:CAMPEP_0173098068 /NCGR_PEP_ID=MMETSP1102-20130122/34447_1 /TAXON_ID=49646 /ORGANISM="Geminigera sp., Strain Caron Lab Isolate" /LENGTH=35 /DNA_ID= /DNA_START= /DNA_END= /DNA_ORIENTATION=
MTYSHARHPATRTTRRPPHPTPDYHAPTRAFRGGA